MAMKISDHQYPKHDPALPVVCLDFDGVVAGNTWPSPSVGELDPRALRMMEWYFDKGCEIIVQTARPESHFRRIWRWLEDLDIDYLVYDITNRKPRACLYFDDRAVRWPLQEPHRGL